ncbi:hypothetical protein LTR70_008968 [Exophiala xenobiotica]|uniref:Thioredoxin-like fold domain-containing protein n=1 Tax=Lithohypha guttulata TaxID=1690604 RepID=A0ABR0K0M6_9EURO|nr:hypothetical protein LTR24_008704 [Lithohypha guttulata]KAK5311166.1 hypothetical protein LTR70_008968 [Exophiala xenobiotica]
MATSSDAPDKLVLYRGFPASNKYTWSPFVSKLEFRLRQSRIPYTLREGSTQKGPSGKIPYVNIAPLTSGDTQDLVGDSSVIINTLVQKGLAEDLNAHLAPEQKATDMSIRALCEDKLYFLGMAERWVDNFYIQRDHILESKPWALRFVIGNLIYNKNVSTLHGQGSGRFTKEQQRKMREEIWTILEGLLAQRRRESGNRRGPFWMLGGEKPTEADAVVFAFANSVLVCDSCPASQTFVRGCGSVMEYASRIHDEYFADYQKWKG